MKEREVNTQYQYKGTIALFGNSGAGKTTLVNNLIYQTESKGKCNTPGYDILFYNTKTLEDNKEDCEKELLIRFFDMGIFDINTNNDVIKEIEKISNIVCFVIDEVNMKSMNYYEQLKRVAWEAKIVLVINKKDKDKLSNVQLDNIKKIMTAYDISETIEINAATKGGVTIFGDYIRKELTKSLNKDNKTFNDYENNFEVCPELIYVKKDEKRSFRCF